MKLKHLFIALLLTVPLWGCVEKIRFITVPLKKGQQPPPTNKDPDKAGGRMPAKTTMCFISSQDGVKIEGIAIGEILSYEIYLDEESCLGIFSNANDFVDFLFQLPRGGYVIQLKTEDYIYRGYVTIE